MNRLELVTALNALQPNSMDVCFTDVKGKVWIISGAFKTKKFKRNGLLFDTGKATEVLIDVIQLAAVEVVT